MQIFDDTFILVHKWLISYVRWCEWDAGPSMTRFGSLSFKYHEDRQLIHGFTLGIISIPDGIDFAGEKLPDMLAKRIVKDGVAILTGRFGKDNATGIAETAVAAGATVDHRIHVWFDYSEVDRDIPTVRMSDGFVVFAQFNRLTEHNSEIQQSRFDVLG